MRTLTALASILLALGAQAHDDRHGHRADIGGPGRASSVTRTVRVVMLDSMRFVPASIAVREGETVRFIVKNDGKLKHEFVLGTAGELAAHAEMMKKFPDMKHSDPNMIALAGGQSEELLWHFSKAGPVAFGCLEVGHYDAGMKGAVNVRRGGTVLPGAR